MTTIPPVAPASTGMAAPATSAGGPATWQSALRTAGAARHHGKAAHDPAVAADKANAAASKAAEPAAGQASAQAQRGAAASSAGVASGAGGSADPQAAGRADGASTGHPGAASPAPHGKIASALIGKTGKEVASAPKPTGSAGDGKETSQNQAGSTQTRPHRQAAATDGSATRPVHPAGRHHDTGTKRVLTDATPKGQGAQTAHAAASGQTARSVSDQSRTTKKHVPPQSPAAQTTLAGALQGVPQHAAGHASSNVDVAPVEKGAHRAEAVAASATHSGARHAPVTTGSPRGRVSRDTPKTMKDAAISASTEGSATANAAKFARLGGQSPAGTAQASQALSGQPLAANGMGQALQGAAPPPAAIAANQSGAAGSSVAQNALSSRLAQASLAVLHDGGGSVTLKLHPATLGSLTITVGTAAGGGTSIGIAASDPSGLAAIQAASANMVQHMASAGVPVTSVSANLAASAQGDAGARQQGQHAPPPRGFRPARADAVSADDVPDPRVIARA